MKFLKSFVLLYSMLQRFCHILLCGLALVLLCSCGSSPKRVEWGEELYVPHASKGYTIFATEGQSSVLRILSPWPGSKGVVKEIFIARAGEVAPEGFEGITIGANPQKVVCMSSSHTAFVDALGCVERIVGVSGSEYLSNPYLVEAVADGRTKEVGYDAYINYEVLASMRPDVVFIYGTSGENGAMSAKLDELHIPYVYIADHTETTPLGKSEWVVAFGEIFDRRAEAEEMFGGIAERYESLRLSVLGAEGRPKVMLNAPYKDVWFVPADDSYVVRLIEDAGGEYICGGEGRSGLSRPISGESAYVYLSKADFWLHPNDARTKAQLISSNPKFSTTKAVSSGNIYNCTARSTRSGGSDFWESGALRADVVLADMISILHPEALRQERELYYYEKVQ